MTACYVLQPAAPALAPMPGMRVAFDLTDAGRTALAGPIGPGIAQLEGRLVNVTGDAYTMAVTNVRLLRGGEQVWQGERVQVQREHVARLYERQFSRGRTVAASATAAVAIGYFAAKTLAGFAQGDQGQPPADTADARRRPVRP
jgi:hypothetical protein